MSNVEHDAAWLVDVATKQARGQPWQREVRAFLDATRDAARNVVRRLQLRMRIPGTREADVDDILAKVDACFVAAISTFRGEASPRTYYLTIATRCAVSFYRRLSEHRELTDAELISDDGAASPLDSAGSGGATEVERWALARDLTRALAELYESSPGLATAVDLFLVQQVGTGAECAARLGIEEPNFNQRVTRGRKLLREILARMGYP